MRKTNMVQFQHFTCRHLDKENFTHGTRNILDENIFFIETLISPIHYDYSI